ncbi:MAG: hypothetical protein M1816_000503 [Peltula sp. TS41687]|nr:MAG: hypothetical protein M1816_000503 [Peltula sp. TS41687]
MIRFIERVRQNITDWQDKPSTEPHLLEITPLNYQVDPINSRPFTNYEKSLVHQLVKREFPDLVSFAKDKWIGIRRYYQPREDAVFLTKQKRLDEQLSRQIGFRWIFEAMGSGDISGIDRDSLARGKAGEPIFVDKGALSLEMSRIESLLGSKRTVLVGHNLFTDLVYLHHHFLGPLPDRVEDFQQTMHALFPMIIDTKYVDSHGNERARTTSLAELDQRLRNQQVPAIETHHDHQQYDHEERPHEGGYDSFVTAKALIRMSRNLQITSDGERISPSMPPHRFGSQTDSDSTTMMPPFRRSFWDVYGNKLRVYGTKEGICELGN